MTLAPPKPSLLQPGFRLGRYELLCPVAQGGMAAVWLARQHGAHGFEKLVAVKTILPEHASDLRFQQMFLDEARLASAVVHQNVGQILDLGEEGEVLYLVLEWIDGDALSKMHRAMEKRGQNMPTGVILRVMADVCGGLHAAHELRDPQGEPLGVVHRDVSPHNVLVTPQGVGKVIDFGIAKARDRLAGETSAGLVKGKLQYMAPEQALGKHVDRRADVFSIGACLYYLLANRPAYDGPNQLAILHVLTSGRAPLPLPNRVPAAVEKVVMKALAFKKEDRFPTAESLHRALEEAMRSGECWTTTHDVAAFLQENFAQRIADRKKAIEIALDAAGDRAKLEQLLRPHVAGESRSGVLLGGAYLKVLAPGSFSGERRLDDLRASTQTGLEATSLAERGDEGDLLPTMAAQIAEQSQPTTRAVRNVELEQATGEAGGEIALHDAPTRSYVFESMETASISEFQPKAPSARSVSTDPNAARDMPRSRHENNATGRTRAPRDQPSPARWMAAVLAVAALAGGSLELTAHGAFFRHDLADRVHGEEHARAEKDVTDKVHAALADDVADRALAALASLDEAVAKAPRQSSLLAFAAYATFAWEARFGGDLDRHGKASVLLERSRGAPTEKLAVAMRDLASGEPAKARGALRAIAEADPQNVDAVIGAGEAELASGNGKEAAQWFARAIAIRATPRARYGLVRALEREDASAAKAKEVAEALARDAPGHVGVRLSLARMALRRAHDPELASRWLKELAKLATQASAAERGEIACLRGHVHLANGEVAAARKDFDESVAAAKGKPSAFAELGLGEAELASNATASALVHFNAAHEIDPSLWEAKIGIARTQIAMGNKADARATLATISEPNATGEIAKWSAVVEAKH